MALQTRSFKSTRPRHSTIEGNSAVNISNFIITEIVPGTARGKIHFSSHENPLCTLQQELYQRADIIVRTRVYFGGNPDVVINPETILKVAFMM